MAKTKNFQLNCDYDHSGNPFDMEHKVKGFVTVSKKKILNFDVDFTSSLFDVFAYKKMKMNICGKGMQKSANESKFLAKNVSKYFKNIKDTDFKKTKIKNNECFTLKKNGSRKLRNRKKKKRSKRRKMEISFI